MPVRRWQGAEMKHDGSAEVQRGADESAGSSQEKIRRRSVDRLESIMEVGDRSSSASAYG